MAAPPALPPRSVNDLDPAALIGGSAALVAGVAGVVWLSADGEVEELSFAAVRRRLADEPPPLVVHARALARRLELPGLAALDLLELLAFARPAEPCVPTPRGLARKLNPDEPRAAIAQAAIP